ncbi:MAG: threonine--tRNA ligase [Chloroflexi bacterium]|nr:MAG: threonine--tRNA ligase [Chloroflexota bacterium]TMF87435.1 MAG: threonine--tRNA ligase [Chloroflexota bacterium]TMG10770.1 MAG: threonine--tRNA ligase [Chloroflexota bacterium]
MTPDPSPFMGRAREGPGCPSKTVHILDDPMSDYGDHESTGDPLEKLRHSTAHLLAAAVTELYPEAKYGIGPAVQDGFYYDFDFGKPISESDLPAIESRMRRLAQADIPFEHEVLPRQRAMEEFQKRGQEFKLELIRDKVEGDEVSVYRTGQFLDLCRGPHVSSTKDLKAFKLLRVAGAYWRGDEKRPQLTRIYGTAWPTPKELDEYLKFLEEAAKRDHKKLGRDLKLFTVDDRVGPGLPLWLPDGATIRRELERFIVDEELARGYLHVRTPDVARLDLYRQSGHAQLYAEYMYPPMKFEDGEELELRPVNCPHHIVVYQTELRSYRDLPLRIAEIGNNWRYERSGTLAGMNRVRSFALNDAHIFCTPEQLMDEVRSAIDLALYFSKVLGIDEFWYQLSTRDDVKDKWLGDEAQWQEAQAALAEALESMGQPYKLVAGEAAFYGPKIDFQVYDAHRREFTNSTVQVDFQLPQRFDLEYVAEDGTRKRPVMVHRGAAGAMERLFSYLIERYAGAFPTWLHPTQVVITPIADAHLEFASEVAKRLRASRVRVHLDGRSERLDRKIRDAKLKKVPYVAVVGGKEVESGHVNVQNRAGEKSDMPLESFVSMISAEIAERRR